MIGIGTLTCRKRGALLPRSILHEDLAPLFSGQIVGCADVAEWAKIVLCGRPYFAALGQKWVLTPRLALRPPVR